MNNSFCSNLVQFASSGPVVAMELMGDEAMSVWRKLVGPTDSAVARREAPQSARAQFGTDGVKNLGHGSDSLAAAAKVHVHVHMCPCSPCSTQPDIFTYILSVSFFFIRSLNFSSHPQLAMVPLTQPSIQTAHAASSNLMPYLKVRSTYTYSNVKGFSLPIILQVKLAVFIYAYTSTYSFHKCQLCKNP